MSDYEVTNNVAEFIRKSTALIGRAYADRVDTILYAQCLDTASPIEQLFLVAFSTIAETLHRKVETAERANAFDIVLEQQVKIGSYRVDFLAYIQPQPGIDTNKVVIECDGHEFHDRDKHHRSYEKKRDRDLQRIGMKVFRFTGSDIVKDPYRCAAEVISEITGDSEEWMLVGINQYAGDEQ